MAEMGQRRPKPWGGTNGGAGSRVAPGLGTRCQILGPLEHDRIFLNREKGIPKAVEF
jgi:hypothetical protein